MKLAFLELILGITALVSAGMIALGVHTIRHPRPFNSVAHENTLGIGASALGLVALGTCIVGMVSGPSW